jgi:hypothetical protein
MAVTPEQWADVATDIGITGEELRERIAKIDNSRAADPYLRDGPAYFDRDGDPLTLGEWAWLYEARSYRFIRTSSLPNGYWVATIWHGTREDDGTVLETSVFPAPPSENKRLVPAIERVTHASMEDALQTHTLIVVAYAATAP